MKWRNSWTRWSSVTSGRNKFAPRYSLIPQNINSERPIALMPTMIRWCEALRALEMAKRHYPRTDAMEELKFKCPAGEEIRETWPWIWTWQRHLSGSVSGCGRVLRASGTCSVRRMCGGASKPSRLFSPTVKMELLTSTYFVAGRIE